MKTKFDIEQEVFAGFGINSNRNSSVNYLKIYLQAETITKIEITKDRIIYYTTNEVHGEEDLYATRQELFQAIKRIFFSTIDEREEPKDEQ